MASLLKERTSVFLPRDAKSLCKEARTAQKTGVGSAGIRCEAGPHMVLAFDHYSTPEEDSTHCIGCMGNSIAAPVHTVAPVHVRMTRISKHDSSALRGAPKGMGRWIITSPVGFCLDNARDDWCASAH